MEIEGYPNYTLDRDGVVRNITTGKVRKPHANKQNGYLQIGLWRTNKGTNFYLHRLLAAHYLPKPSEAHTIVDHINRVVTDNRLENLRWVTPAESNLNMSAQERDNHNCYWREDAQLWRVIIQRDHKTTYLGSTKTLEEARALRDQHYLTALKPTGSCSSREPARR